MMDERDRISQIRIGSRIVGDGCPVYMIAEMSANHAGSLERAKEIIHAAKESGADCIKIQTYTPDTLTIDCGNPYFQVKNGTWEGENLYGLYGKAYTPWEWQGILKEEADKAGIDFLSTPFDRTSVDFLEELGLSFYKIASFEMVDLPLLEYVASKGKPIIMSTGMGTLEEIREAVETVYAAGNKQLALLKCSSAYPADPADMHLSTIHDMRRRFKVPVGLSDHSLGSLSSVTAVALGASIIEKHFCISREIDNPDASFSMTPVEYRTLVDEVRAVEKAKGAVYYGASEQEKENIVFRRSLFVVRDVKQGEVFTEDNIRVIRPGFGLHPREYEHVLGRHSGKNLERGTPLAAANVEDYVTLVPAREEQEELIFTWANEEETRKQSFTTATISKETHRTWYGAALASGTRDLYVCYHGETPVGLFRSDLLSHEEAEISYQIDARYRGRGYAGAMLHAGEVLLQQKHPMLKKLSARVRLGNTASRKLLQKLGYAEKKQDESSILYEKVL